MPARWKSNGPHVWERGAGQARRAGRAGKAKQTDERGFEVRSSRFSELRTPNPELRIAFFSPVVRVPQHRLWPLADCFSILLEPKGQLGQLQEGVRAGGRRFVLGRTQGSQFL